MAPIRCCTFAPPPVKVGFASLGYMLIGSLMDMPSRVQTTPIPPS